jgi:hypothetical protein
MCAPLVSISDRLPERADRSPKVAPHGKNILIVDDTPIFVGAL